MFDCVLWIFPLGLVPFHFNSLKHCLAVGILISVWRGTFQVNFKNDQFECSFNSLVLYHISGNM